MLTSVHASATTGDIAFADGSGGLLYNDSLHWDNTNHKLVATATKSDEVLTVGNFDTTSSNNPAGIVGYTEGVGNDSIDLSGPVGVGGAANTGIGVIGVSSTGYGGLFCCRRGLLLDRLLH